MTKRVLLTDNIALAALAVFEDYDGIEAVRTDTLAPEELLGTIADFEAIVVRSPTTVDAKVIAAGKRLRYIGRAGVGVDNIDVEAATARGIVVMNSPGANTISTAEHTMALMLAAARRIPQAHASVTGGEWDRAAFRGTELSGKTLGIVGLGRVGREVAVRARAFGMEIVASDPYVTGEEVGAVGASLVPLDDLLARSDWITVHVPLGTDTRSLVGAPEIEKMKKGVVLINCARGGVIDEEALADALTSGRVAACGIDVYDEEPPGRHRLFAHPRSVFTPHLGAATGEAQLRVATDIARNIAEALAHGSFRDVVNPAALTDAP